MSDGLNLNRELIEQLLHAIAEHDAQAQEDMLVNLQYLCAVAGYLAADYPGPDSERDELLEHLHALMKHVCDDRAHQQATPQTPSQPAANTSGNSVATDDPAVGIWKPD
jgi:hypothetical protein